MEEFDELQVMLQEFGELANQSTTARRKADDDAAASAIATATAAASRSSSVQAHDALASKAAAINGKLAEILKLDEPVSAIKLRGR